MALLADDQPLLIHNPSCSKSRALAAALEERGIAYRIRLYLDDPLDEDELAELCRRLGDEPRALVRAGDEAYGASGLTATSSRQDLIDALACDPRLLQRPILVCGPKAAIGRPLEAALALV